MSYLEKQIAEVEAEAKKQIDYGKMILNILDSLDLSPRCSAINNEHLYSAAELEAILKIRRDKKEQATFKFEVQRLLNFYKKLLEVSSSQEIFWGSYYNLKYSHQNLPL